MFYSRMRQVPVSKPITADDGYGFKYKDYADAGTAPCYITYLSFTLLTTDNLKLAQKQLVAYTSDKDIEVGWLVDGCRVTAVVPARNFNTLYLQKVDGADEG